MRQSIKRFAVVVSRTLPISGPVVDFGALQVAGQGQFADLRSIFPDLRYVGVDMRAGPGVNLLLNFDNIPFAGGTVGTGLCLDTLEHVEFPHQAVAEMYRTLSPQGILVLSSVMDFPIHEHPHDYWRFSPDGFRSLLASFQSCFVGFAGRLEHPHTVIGIGFKGSSPSLNAFESEYRAWQAAMSRPASVREYLRLLLPPVLYSPLARLVRGFGRRS